MTEETFVGLLKSEEEHGFATKLDALIDFRKVIKNKFLGITFEAFDGKFFQLAISSIDNNFGKKLPEKYKKDSRTLILAFLDNDWKAVIDVAPKVINIAIDVKGLDEDQEYAILSGFVQTAYATILALAKNKIKEKDEDTN